MATKKENRGGARPGAGRKPIGLSEINVSKLCENIEKAAKENKTSPGQELAYLMFRPLSRTFKPRDKLAALKLYYDLTVIKCPSQTVEENRPHLGPIILPAIEYDHAKNEAQRLELQKERLESERKMKDMKKDRLED